MVLCTSHVLPNCSEGANWNIGCWLDCLEVVIVQPGSVILVIALPSLRHLVITHLFIGLAGQSLWNTVWCITAYYYTIWTIIILMKQPYLTFVTILCLVVRYGIKWFQQQQQQQLIGCKMQLCMYNCACASTTYSLYMLQAVYNNQAFWRSAWNFQAFRVMSVTTRHWAVGHSAPSLVSFCCRLGGWLASPFSVNLGNCSVNTVMFR